ncbi:ATP-binding protein [Clostridiaceae bacterium 35-E11]
MPIYKKIIFLVLLAFVVPMLVIDVLSHTIIKKQIENAAQAYLKNALRVARNQMLNRLGEIEKLSTKTVKSSSFQKAVKEENTKDIHQTIQDIQEVYGYIDFFMVLSKENRLLINQPNIKNPHFPRLNQLIEKARLTQETIIAEEVFPLGELFHKDSNEYNRFKVLMNDPIQMHHEDQYLTKALVGVSVSPIYHERGNELIGFLIVGDIGNHDTYLPKVYSESVEDSYLSISIDGIRVISNIRSPKTKNYIGSTIPISMNSLEGAKDVYYGKENYDGEIHLFLDEPILDGEGNILGVLGVGIPAQKFSVIMNTQRNLIMLVSFFCFVGMLFISRYVANRIIQPIEKATAFAHQIAQGNHDIKIEEEFLGDTKSETTILLKAFQKMALDLKESEEERRNYLEKLQYEHFEQRKLAKALKVLNERLEEKVKIRTQDLQQAMMGLKKADAAKSRFIANMSHELRTPLSAIITSAEALKEEIFGPLNEKQHQYMNNITYSSTHLLELINNILDISKIEAGKMQLSLDWYAISDVIMDSFCVLKSLANQKNIELSIDMVPRDFKVKVDGKKLKQIFYNLLSNAIKFTPAYGKVEVRVLEQKDFMELRVKDNGIGIKEEDQERIFYEFEQVDGSYEREYEGTGLGLPLTKKLVAMHGGNILLISKIGRGTEVIVTLPIQ